MTLKQILKRTAFQMAPRWAAEVDDAKWDKPPDIKARYVSSSFFADRHVVFNIKGSI